MAEGLTPKISIHALREEGDLADQVTYRGITEFLSTPSARRATRSTQSPTTRALYFYPRPPRGGRHRPGWCAMLLQEFLSTPSARRATGLYRQHLYCPMISIHALREEGDVSILAEPSVLQKFLSTPSARRATGRRDPLWRNISISIHALREEGDGFWKKVLSDFALFLSTPSARRATFGCY